MATPKNDKKELATRPGAVIDIKAVERDIRNAPIEVVDKKASIGTPLTDPAALMEALANAASADEAARILHSGAGIVPFANKKALARSGASFSVRRLVIREEGGFSGGDDIAALISVNGAPQVLTFEQNKGRNHFMFGLNEIIKNFGEATNWALERYGSDDDNEKHFYVMVPATLWNVAGDQRGTSAETYEAEYTQG